MQRGETMNDTLIKQVEPFVCCNGAQLNSVRDLALALEDMDGSVYGTHVTDERNDFAAWIANVTGDEALADTIGQTKDQHQMRDQVLKHIVLTL